jgi:hypothetical protein
MNNLEYLSTYSTRMEAEGIKRLLEDNGIPCFLQFDSTGDVMEGVGVDNGPTAIYVPPKHLASAREIAGVEKRG